MIRVTESELLTELRSASMGETAPADAMTSSELADALGLKSSAIKDRLRRLRKEGRLLVWKRRQVDAAGRMQIVPAYTITPAPKRKRA